MSMTPEDFLNQTVTGSNSTVRTPVPAGDYPSIISDIKYRVADRRDGSGKMHMLDVVFSVDDANAREATGLPEPTVRKTIFLDLTSENKLDMSKGKNVDLGKLREALGLNDPSKEFSFGQLKGQACYVRVVHNPNKENPSEVFANVGAIGKEPLAA